VREHQPGQPGQHLVLLPPARVRGLVQELVERGVVGALADQDAAGSAELLDGLGGDGGGGHARLVPALGRAAPAARA
jgi:hypothetical protein